MKLYKSEVLFFYFLSIILLLSTCEKDKEPPDITNKIEFGVTNIAYLKYNSSEVSTHISGVDKNMVTQHGHCWSTDPLPDIDDEHTSLGKINVDTFYISQITGLQILKTYYCRPYAIVNETTLYGNVTNFTTPELELPEVSTSALINITSSSATSGGTINSEGNGTISARGVCWNKSGNPSLENYLNYTNDDSGAGSYTSILTGLVEISTYYVKAYATNEKGTSYGEERSFVAENPPCGELTIYYGGQVYHTVEIDDQCWFKENLNIGTRINGIQNQHNNSTIEKYCYNDLESNCDEYGGLYQLDEAMQYVTTQGAQGICPDGWHIPTDGEWDEQVDYLGGSGVAGGKMKETGYEHWNSHNTGATNSSGFTGLPGGNRHWSSGSFNYLGYHGYFWSSTELDASYAWLRLLFYANYDVYRYYYYKTYGFSVRCLQD